ncbi:MAG: T9SS type A sorting domain-containing protein [Candidatus Cloacimonetes bacterium]|nr:T9SS type A sorting domain-containing protein [Candidatus Cloacimonadota bacterium]
MKKIGWMLICISFITYSFASEYDKIVKFDPYNSSIPDPAREEIITYEENFEAGSTDWISTDITDPGSFWFTGTFNAFGGSGKSWRMADVEIEPDGGYLDSWYQILDTPVITLPNSGELTLTFEQYRAIEELGEYENFNGWDGFNIRIRTSEQDYEEAEILTDCIPAYNSSSMYSFGFEHGEDIDGIPGIPGWGGSTDWITTTVTIPDSYLGQNIIISFAFASDPNTSTASNPEFTGVFVDNINVADVFTNDGEDETGFNAFSNTVVGGNLWHIFDDTSAPSPSHAYGCFDPDTGTYNPNMQNYIISPSITLPADGLIFFDMFVKTEFDDILFPDCDYFSVEISYYCSNPWMTWWTSWNSISNPTGEPNGTDVVFTGSVNEWSLFSEGWQGYNDISVLSGKNIKLRIGFHSNENTPETSGIHIDNIMIRNVIYSGFPPENLSVELLEDLSVELKWNTPASRDITGYNIYFSGESCGCFELINTVTDTTFIHTDPVNNSNNYYVVTALFDDEESAYSNEVFTFVPNSSAAVLLNDDGSSESGFNVGTLHSMAVKFTPVYYSETLTLTHAEIYIHELNSGPLVLKMWDDNNGVPGDVLMPYPPVSFSASELIEGWNTLEIPVENRPQFSSGSFFVGIQEFENLSAIGLDENSAGFSYTDENGWEIVDAGNIMIRAIVDSNPTDIDESTLDMKRPVISNYPNPFNPETTIRLDIPANGRAILNVYNIKGQLVRTLLDDDLETGIKFIKWNGLDNNNSKVTSGIYLYKLQMGEINIIKKMLMLK